MDYKKTKLRPFLYAACILSAVVGVETVNNTHVFANEEVSSLTTLSSENLETVTPSEQIKPSEELSSPVVTNEDTPSSTDENIMNSDVTQPGAQQETTEISIATQNESGHNAFDFNGNRWVKAANEAYVDLAKNSSEIADHYYTIKFAGNGIDLLAIKSHNHGIVDIYLNDEKHGTVDLYNSRRGRVEAVYSIRNLQEGVHNLRVVSTGENNKANTRARYVNQVVGARIYHAPYQVENLTFAEEEITLKVGATKQLAPEVVPSYVTNPRIQYTSHAPEVVSVDSSGLISALKQGNARVTATVDGISKDINVLVEAAISQMKGSFVDNNLHYTSAEHTQVVSQMQSAHRIDVWRNDQANAQISIVAVDSTLKNVRYELTDLVHSETGERLSGAQVTANFIKELSGYRGNAGYHNANKLNIPTTPSISRPDMLLREQSVNVPFNGVQNLWLNVAVPKEAAAGTYRTTVKVYADEISEPMTFDLTVEVAKAVLENNNKRFDIELWQYPYRSAEYYGVTPFSEEHFNILRPHLEKYKSIGGNGITASIVEEAWGGQTYADGEVRVPSMIKWRKQADGTFAFDYTDFDKWVAFAESMGLGDKIVGYSMIPWGNRIVYFDEATNQLASMTLPVDNPQYALVWKQFLINFTAHLDSKDWFDKFYMGIDERPRMELAFDVIDTVKNKDGKSLKIAAAANHFSGSFAKVASRIHHLSIGTPHMKSEMAAFKQFVAERNAKGLKTTLYTATEEYPNNLLFNIPGESYFTVLYGAKFNTNGFLRWAFDAWVKTPTTDLSHWAFESGDTQLIYPDEKNTVNPLSRSSVRLEKMAEAVRDVNKLYQIREEVPSLAREIDELLATLNDSYSQHTRHNGLGRQIAREPNDTTRRLISEDVRNFKIKLAEITAKYIDYLATATDEVTEIELDTTPIELEFAETRRLEAQIVGKVKDNRLTYTSSNPNILAIDASGVMTAQNIGKVTIRVTSVKNPEITKEVSVAVRSVDILEKLKENLIHKYTFDGSVNDMVGELNPQDIGEVNYVDGIVDKAIHIVRNQPLTLEDVDLTSNYTLSFWMNYDNPQTGISSIFWDGVELSGQRNSTSLDLRIGQGGTPNNMGVHVPEGILTFKYAASLSGWNHYAFINNGTELLLYVNGEKQANIRWNKPVKLPLKHIGGKNFEGDLDSIYVFNKVLSDEQVAVLALRPGINVMRESQTVKMGQPKWIGATLNQYDSELHYEVENTDLLAIDSDGMLTPLALGSTVVTIKTADGKLMKQVSVDVTKDFATRNQLPTVVLPSDKKFVMDRKRAEYLGQPDMVKLKDDRTLITIYPKGHGHGELVMKRSEDGGITWSERLVTNPTWVTSKETPTLYTLDFTDGRQEILLVTGGPKLEGWGDGTGGISTSISKDKGATWSDFQQFYPNQQVVVGLASLVQVYENGQPIDKWLGVFHDLNYVNYKMYLTFDEQGNQVWTQPEAYLADYRNIEQEYQICEVNIFRSPDKSTLVALGRTQSHNNFSTIFFSYDEGKTWTKPRNLPASLTGERHQAVYDPISGRLLITFREIILDWNNNGRIERNDWMAGDWVAWVGTYEDLIKGNDGEYRILLSEDFTPNAKSGDTGYSGNIVLNDGTYVINSYGVFFEEDARVAPRNTKPNIRWTTSIMGTRFTLADLDKLVYGEQQNPNLEPAPDELIDDTTGVIVRFNGIDKAKTKRLRVARVGELPIVPEILSDAEYELFNISPLSRNNDKVHIVNEAVVRIPIQSNKVVDKVIYLLPETGALEVLPHRVDNNHVEFTVSHFSVYGIIYAKSRPTDTVTDNPKTDTGTTAPPKDTDTGTTVPPKDTDTGTTAPPKDTDTGTTAPPKDTDTGTTAPPKDTDTGTTAPPKDTDTGTTAPPKDADTGTTAPPKDTDTGTTAPPKDTDTGTTAPPKDTDTETTALPKDTDTGTTAPPKDADTGTTAPPKDADTGTIISPKLTSDDEQYTQTVSDSDEKSQDGKSDSFNQSTQARNEAVEILVATGEEAAYSIFGGAALAILVSLGLVPSYRKSEE
ncbi:DUF6067 family protein [Aerococcaceae bacterium NML160702]|nr:DUF6067 family protein [Aerococcaceae bacterium NML160702]